MSRCQLEWVGCWLSIPPPPSYRLGGRGYVPLLHAGPHQCSMIFCGCGATVSYVAKAQLTCGGWVFTFRSLANKHRKGVLCVAGTIVFEPRCVARHPTALLDDSVKEHQAAPAAPSTRFVCQADLLGRRQSDVICAFVPERMCPPAFTVVLLRGRGRGHASTRQAADAWR